MPIKGLLYLISKSISKFILLGWIEIDFEIDFNNPIIGNQRNSVNVYEADLNDIYNSNQVKLQFGETYYIQVHAFDNEGIHGIPSTVTSLFIPNVIPAVLNEPFSWNPTVPESDLYNIQVSTTDDFTVSSIVVDSLIENTSMIVWWRQWLVKWYQ